MVLASARPYLGQPSQLGRRGEIHIDLLARCQRTGLRMALSRWAVGDPGAKRGEELNPAGASPDRVTR